MQRAPAKTAFASRFQCRHCCCFAQIGHGPSAPRRTPGSSALSTCSTSAQRYTSTARWGGSPAHGLSTPGGAGRALRPLLSVRCRRRSDGEGTPDSLWTGVSSASGSVNSAVLFVFGDNPLPKLAILQLRPAGKLKRKNHETRDFNVGSKSMPRGFLGSRDKNC